MNAFTTAVVAQAGTAAEDQNFFWSTSGGRILQALLFAVGILVVLAAAARAFKDISQGQVGKGVKIVVGAAVLASFLFVPTLITSLINFLSGIIGGLLGSGSEIINEAPLPDVTTTAPAATGTP